MLESVFILDIRLAQVHDAEQQKNQTGEQQATTNDAVSAPRIELPLQKTVHPCRIMPSPPLFSCVIQFAEITWSRGTQKYYSKKVSPLWVRVQ